jgi:cytoskeletal protein CcmA (bactofilin family)
MSNTFRPGPAGKVTIVEEGTEFKGTLTSSCPIDVRGKVEGELNTPALTVSASGAVHGRAKVGAVRSQGEISGEFEADSIELAGVVRDNTVIRAKSLDVKLAASRGKLQIIFGECELAVGDEPTEMDQVAPPVQAAIVAPAPEMMAAAAPMAEAVAEVAAVATPDAAVATPDAAVATPDASVAAAAPDAAAAAAPGAEAEAAEGEEEELEADASGGKRKRKRKNGQQEEPRTGWSHPPSQPPPAG